ncbi:MAG: DUF192 domain-containing protein [Methanobrevibacter sp.]|jgi:uncharacterized membrane protein (UPF0127 family)|nr:DUF192 domain-containing protein [Methanobrevibacter sp.]
MTISKTLIYNNTKEKLINIQIKFANSYLTRLRGLMLKKNINYSLALKINNNSKISSSIHTCFMFFEIDVFFVDEHMKIFEIARLKPWKMYTPNKSAKYIIEFKKGTLKNGLINLGDEIEFVCENS